MRVLRENVTHEAAENEAADPDSLAFDANMDTNDDKLFAAMGIAKTLSTVCLKVVSTSI